MFLYVSRIEVVDNTHTMCLVERVAKVAEAKARGKKNSSKTRLRTNEAYSENIYNDCMR